jgi:hypothetical protein
VKARIFENKHVVEVNSLGVDDPLYEIARHKNGFLYLYHYRGSFSRSSMSKSFDYGEKVILPPEENEFTTNTRFASKLEEYESVAGLLRSLEDFVSQCIDVSESDRFLLACFALSTWVADFLPVAPYLALTGLPGSGKSTALSVLHSVCYRGLMTSDINPTAIYQAYACLKPTILIDEPGGGDGTKALLRLLRVGTNRSAVNYRGLGSCSAFGPKAFAWSQIPSDDALASRCINIAMVETSRNDLRRLEYPGVRTIADTLQCQLLLFRLDHGRGRKLVSSQLPIADSLRPRDRDLYEALSLPIRGDAMACERLAAYFIKRQESFDRDPLPVREAAIIETLFEQIHIHDSGHYFAIRELTAAVNSTLLKLGERLHLSHRAAGAGLTTLGFRNHKRTQTGFVIEFDRNNRRRIHELVTRYCLETPSAHLPSGQKTPCEFCEEKQAADTRLPTDNNAEPRAEPESTILKET